MEAPLRLLDLFCCEGGAARGYADAGFEVTGVDSTPQPRYPYAFHHADALTFDLSSFDVIHASPPCQAYSITKHTHSRQHPDLVAATRQRLVNSGKPYVIENVPGAPLVNPLVLCGAAFALTTIDRDGTPLVLKRHRLFETNLPLPQPPPCQCKEYRQAGFAVGGVYGGGSHDRNHAKYVRKGGYTPGKQQRSELIGADWMTQHGLSQSIPPAYTRWLGTQVLAALKAS